MQPKATLSQDSVDKLKPPLAELARQEPPRPRAAASRLHHGCEGDYYEDRVAYVATP